MPDHPSSASRIPTPHQVSALAGLSHVAFATGDLEKTIRFWRDLLGLRLVLSFGKQGDKQYFFEVAERQLLGFFEWEGVEPITEKDAGYPTRGPAAFDHVAIALTSLRALWEIKDKLEAADLWVTEVVDHGIVLSLYTFDPNGIAVELCVNTDVDVSADPQLYDRDPDTAAQQGSEPQPGYWPEPERRTPESEWKQYPGFGYEIGKRHE